MYKHTKQQQMTDTKATIIFTIDEEKKKKFHGLCVQHDTTMTKVLRKYVDHYIDEHKPRFKQIG